MQLKKKIVYDNLLTNILKKHDAQNNDEAQISVFNFLNLNISKTYWLDFYHGQLQTFFINPQKFGWHLWMVP